MTGSLPRYIRIQHTLENAILSGKMRPGRRVPPEHELVKRYRCSRMTVNKALSALAASGLIVRKRRSGSFVSSPIREGSVVEIHDIEAEVRSAGKNYRFVLISRGERSATKEDARRLAISSGTRVLALKCLHFANGDPLVMEDRLINLDAVPAARLIDFASTSPGGWLLAAVPWSQAEHHIRAVNADLKTARTLRINKASACLIIERRTWQADENLTHVVLTFPGERHQLVARFNPSSSSAMRTSD